MSLSTWKAVAYPISADELEAQGASDIELVKHALNKWKHLRSEVLVAHEVYVDRDGDLRDSETQLMFSISSSTCSLCAVYLTDQGDCYKCPLNQLRGMRCDKWDGDYDNPFMQWQIDGDPEQMITALQKTLAILESGG